MVWLDANLDPYATTPYPLNRLLVRLVRPPTAFGVVLTADQWEWARIQRKGHLSLEEQSWENRYYAARTKSKKEVRIVLKALASRARKIGMDHSIRRRKLNWEVQPGTLATLEQKLEGVWVFRTRGENGGGCSHTFQAPEAFNIFSWPWTEIPALAGINDRDEALKVIWREVFRDME